MYFIITCNIQNLTNIYAIMYSKRIKWIYKDRNIGIAPNETI